MSTRPSGTASASAWLQAVIKVQKTASNRNKDEKDLQESIEPLLAAGTVGNVLRASMHLFRLAKNVRQ